MVKKRRGAKRVAKRVVRPSRKKVSVRSSQRELSKVLTPSSKTMCCSTLKWFWVFILVVGVLFLLMSMNLGRSLVLPVLLILIALGFLLWKKE